MLQKLHKIAFILFVWAISSNATATAEDIFIENACNRVFYTDTTTLEQNRKDDYRFNVTDIKCCCRDKILQIFANRTKAENSRVNSATDIQLHTLAELEKTIRLKIKAIEDYKQINNMYSFIYVKYTPTHSKVKVKQGDIGCREVDLTNPDDLNFYLGTVDAMETGGSASYTAHNTVSGATGRYQIMPKFAKDWCKHTQKANCCAIWKTDKVCQDQMFDYFTKQNISEMQRANLPLTNCSLYIAHQQGVGGANWIYGGNLPKAFRHDDGTPKIKVIKDNIVKNLSGDFRKRAEATNDIDELREIYKEYWSNRFGGDITSGDSTSVEDFVDNYNVAEEKLEERKNLWREGIILDTREVLHNLDMILQKKGF